MKIMEFFAKFVAFDDKNGGKQRWKEILLTYLSSSQDLSRG